MKENSGKRIGHDGRKYALRAGLARCAGRRPAEGGAAAERGRTWRLAGAGASGCDRSGKPFTMANGIANVRRLSPALAHSPAPHCASFLFPSARRGVKSALLDSSCCGGKKEKSKKRGEKESHLFLSSAQRESKGPRRLWNSTETLPFTANHMDGRTPCG